VEGWCRIERRSLAQIGAVGGIGGESDAQSLSDWVDQQKLVDIQPDLWRQIRKTSHVRCNVAVEIADERRGDDGEGL
jgi:hypothetical protein